MAERRGYDEWQARMPGEENSRYEAGVRHMRRHKEEMQEVRRSTLRRRKRMHLTWR